MAVLRLFTRRHIPRTLCYGICIVALTWILALVSNWRQVKGFLGLQDQFQKQPQQLTDVNGPFDFWSMVSTNNKEATSISNGGEESRKPDSSVEVQTPTTKQFKAGQESESSQVQASQQQETDHKNDIPRIETSPKLDKKLEIPPHTGENVKSTEKSEEAPRPIVRWKKPTGGTPLNESEIRTISFWDPLDQKKMEWMFRLDFSQCDFRMCLVTRDITKADAVVFEMERLVEAGQPNFPRNPKQIWIFKSMEAPSRFGNFDFVDKPHYREMFNWTMTFRLDSDIPTPFAYTRNRGHNAVKDYHAVFQRKSKTIAHFASYCEVPSNNSRFVEQVMTLLEPNAKDTFSPCTSVQCGSTGPRPWDHNLHKTFDMARCFPMLDSIYKFVFFIETSLCEKHMKNTLFEVFNDVDAVPVVLGDHGHVDLFPANTYIEASQFSSAEELAEFLSRLAKDEKRYTQYLRDKDRYKIESDPAKWQCILCERLHFGVTTKTYKNIHEWWTKSPCFEGLAPK